MTSLLSWLLTATKATLNRTPAGRVSGARTIRTAKRNVHPVGYPLEMTATGVSRVMPPAMP